MEGLITYSYNDEGIRISKTVDGVEHKYQLNGTQIISETWGNHMIFYIYDEMGTIAGMRYRTSDYAAGVFDEYLFEKNLHGDVVAIYNASGTKLVSYTYDAWGKVTTTYSSGGASTGARYNPFKYRGYYHDDDTGFYYLNTRYYDPSVGRFISADAYISTGQGIVGYNMYAYCNNNPIMLLDCNGEFPWFALIVVGIFAIGGGIFGFTSDDKLFDDSQKSIRPIKHELQSNSNNVYQEQTEELSVEDRIKNTFYGFTAGLITGGAVVAVAGVAGSLAIGSGAKIIAIFGGSGSQTFAIGAAAFDIGAAFAGIFGITVEPIECEPISWC